MERDFGDARAFRREYLGEWTAELHRCEVRTNTEQCVEVAVYGLAWDEKTGHVCARCLSGWLHELTRRGPVSVWRLTVDG